MSGLTHLDESGRARMVDVSHKHVTHREATARAVVTMQPETARLNGSAGDSLGDALGLTLEDMDAISVSAPSPRLRGEGRGEGEAPNAQCCG